MRWILAFASVVVLTFVTPSVAQVSKPPETAAPAAQESLPLTPDAVEAARDVMRAALVESRALEVAAETSFAQLGPQMRANLEQVPEFRDATTAHRQAVFAYIDRSPNVASEMMNARLPAIIDAGAQRIAPIMEIDDLHALAAYLRTPGGRSLFLHGVVAGATQATGGAGASDPPTQAETDAAIAFGATPAGQRVNSHTMEFGAAVHEAMVVGFDGLAPLLGARFRRDICALMEHECPASMRNAT